MISLHITDTDGSKRSIQVKENPSNSLMEVLTSENFDVPAICGGMAGCGTCHIQVARGLEKLDQPDDDETFMLDTLPNLTDQSRLSCQIPVTKALNELEITVLGDM